MIDAIGYVFVSCAAIIGAALIIGIVLGGLRALSEARSWSYRFDEKLGTIGAYVTAIGLFALAVGLIALAAGSILTAPSR